MFQNGRKAHGERPLRTGKHTSEAADAISVCPSLPHCAHGTRRPAGVTPRAVPVSHEFCTDTAAPCGRKVGEKMLGRLGEHDLRTTLGKLGK